MERLERNIPLFLAWQAVNSGLFWLPVFILYYLAYGLSYTQIMLLAVFTGVVQPLPSLPTAQD